MASNDPILQPELRDSLLSLSTLSSTVSTLNHSLSLSSSAFLSFSLSTSLSLSLSLPLSTSLSLSLSLCLYLESCSPSTVFSRVTRSRSVIFKPLNKEHPNLARDSIQGTNPANNFVFVLSLLSLSPPHPPPPPPRPLANLSVPMRRILIV